MGKRKGGNGEKDKEFRNKRKLREGVVGKDEGSGTERRSKTAGKKGTI